jgi:hypothetical protein
MVTGTHHVTVALAECERMIGWYQDRNKDSQPRKEDEPEKPRLFACLKHGQQPVETVGEREICSVCFEEKEVNGE